MAPDAYCHRNSTVLADMDAADTGLAGMDAADMVLADMGVADMALAGMDADGIHIQNLFHHDSYCHWNSHRYWDGSRKDGMDEPEPDASHSSDHWKFRHIRRNFRVYFHGTHQSAHCCYGVHCNVQIHSDCIHNEKIQSYIFLLFIEIIPISIHPMQVSNLPLGEATGFS